MSLGIHAMTETFCHDGENRTRGFGGAGSYGAGLGFASMGRTLIKPDFGMEVTHAKMVSLAVRAEYRVRPLPRHQSGAYKPAASLVELPPAFQNRSNIRA